MRRAWVRRPFSIPRGVSNEHDACCWHDACCGVGWRRTKDDETSTHGSSEGTASKGLESQEDAGNQNNAAESGVEAHGDVGNTRLQVVLANVLEVEITVEASEPAGESNEHLGERWMDVHEEFSLDVLGSKATEAGCILLVDVSRWLILRLLTGPRQRRHWWAGRF